MDARGIRRSRSEEEEESYFISMADMMVGLVFVFVILLLYFALQFQQKSQAISNAGETRAQLLRDLRDDLAKHNLRVIPRLGSCASRRNFCSQVANTSFRMKGLRRWHLSLK